MFAYTFTDIIKNRFLQEFTEISIESLLIALLLSFVLTCFVVLIYRLTYSGVLYNHGFALSLILLSMVTSLVIITVSSNVVLSLGMVGALSIVRFRTAVKEPMDTIFMFWAIVIGITTGAGLIPTAIIATLTIGLIFLLVNLAGNRSRSSSYMVIIRFDGKGEEAVERAMQLVPQARLKSRSSGEMGEEVVLELRMNQETQKAFHALKEEPGVKEVNLISYTGSTLL